MSNTDYIRNRTNQILRARIALGATQGAGSANRKVAAGSKTGKRKYVRRAGVMAGSRKRKPCVEGKYRRSGYIRKTGTKVRSTCVKRRASNKPKAPIKRKIVKRKTVKKQKGGEFWDDDESEYVEGVMAGPTIYAAGRRRTTRKPKTSGWINFVKDYSAANNISYGEALSEAGPIWRSLAH